MRQCELCDRTEKTHRIGKESGLCTPCEVALVYWRRKSAAKIMKRVRQVQSFARRFEVLTGGGSFADNVVSISSAKRRRIETATAARKSSKKRARR